jgi:hypothetical protein
MGASADPGASESAVAAVQPGATSVGDRAAQPARQLKHRELPRDGAGETFVDCCFEGFDGLPESPFEISDAPPVQWLGSLQPAALIADCVFERCHFRGPLSGVRFRRCAFVGCHFHLEVRSVEFDACRFESCHVAWASFEACKMKFSRCVDNTFDYAVFNRCDLYRAAFLAPRNTFSNALLSLVSLTRASLDQSAGISRASFDGADASDEAMPERGMECIDCDEAVARRRNAVRRARGRPPLIQEDEQEYQRLLASTLEKTLAMEPTLNGRLGEACEVWRAVSGSFTTNGNYRDAAWAYVLAKRRERRSCKPWRKRYVERDGRWQLKRRPPRPVRESGRYLALAAADLLCGFGNAVSRVLAALVALVLLFAAALSLGHGVAQRSGRPVHFLQALQYAVGQLATSPPKTLALTGVWWEVGAGVETLLGVALVGLFGFVVANRLRFA